MEYLSIHDILQSSWTCKRCYNLRKHVSKTSDEVLTVKPVDALRGMINVNAMPLLNYGLYLGDTEISDVSPLDKLENLVLKL